MGFSFKGCIITKIHRPCRCQLQPAIPSPTIIAPDWRTHRDFRGPIVTFDPLYSLDLLHLLLLIGAGVLAGFINTLAGGGSIFTLPALMLLGLPADVANGTNRVGVLMQSIAGVRGLHRQRPLEPRALLPILMPTVIGALAGAVLASILPVDLLKPLLLGTMMLVTLSFVLRPSAIPGAEETPLSPRQRPQAWGWLLLAGVYGGFVQAGVGFILLTALAGVLRYDLLRANALKLLCTLLFSVVALAVFIIQGQVQWLQGLLMGAASIVGVQLSVRFAIRAQQRTLRWLMLTMAMVVCLAALLQ